MVSEKSRLRAGRCIGFHEKVKRLCTAPSKSLPVLRGDACRETQTPTLRRTALGASYSAKVCAKNSTSESVWGARVISSITIAVVIPRPSKGGNVLRAFGYNNKADFVEKKLYVLRSYP